MPVPIAVPPSGRRRRRFSASSMRSLRRCQLRRPGAEFLPERQRHRVHQVRAAGLDDLGQLACRARSMVAAQVLQRRQQVLDHAPAAPTTLDRGRDHVVGTLAEVDVVVGMHRACRRRARPAWRSPRWHSCCSRCPSRSGTRRSGTARRARRRRPRSAAARIASATPLRQQAEAGVDLGGRGLDQAERADEVARHRQAGDREVLHRALGLRAPQRVGGHLQLAHAVAFDAEACAVLAMRSPRMLALVGQRLAADRMTPRPRSRRGRRRTSRGPRRARPPAMSDAALLALSPLDGRYAGKVDALRPIFSEYGLIKARVQGRGRMAAGAGRRAGHRRTRAVLRRRRRSACARSPTASRRRRRGAREGDRAHHQPRRQGGRVLHQGAPEGRRRAGARRWSSCTSPAPPRTSTTSAYALMLQRGARVRAAAEARRADRRRCATMAHEHAALPMLSRTHGQTASPTTRRQGTRQRRRAPAAPGASSSPRVALPGKINGAVGNYNAHVAAYPGRRLAGVRASASSNRSASTCNPTPRRSSRTTASPSCATRSAASTPSLHRPVPRHLGLHLARLLQAGGEGRRSRQLDHAAQGQSDRLRERRRQLRHRQRAVRAFRRQAADQPLAARPHRLDRAARARHRVRPRAGRARCAAARPRQAQRRIRERLAADLDDAWEVLAEPCRR